MRSKISPDWSQFGVLDQIEFEIRMTLKLTLYSYRIWRRAWQILPRPIKFSFTVSVVTLVSLLVLPSHPAAIPGAIVIGISHALIVRSVERIRERRMSVTRKPQRAL